MQLQFNSKENGAKRNLSFGANESSKIFPVPSSKGMAGRATIPTLCLKAHASNDESLMIDRSPFRIGRRGDNHAQIIQTDISGRHAEFVYENDEWYVVDPGSTNGTFVNGTRVSGRARIRIGDTVHLATKGFLLIPKEDDGGVLSCQTQVMGNSDEIRDMVGLLEVINENRVYSYFQPIIELDSKRTVGWEALGRASTRHGPVNPGILFSLAQQSRAEMRLSEIFRESALHCTECRFCWPHQQKSYMFINIHPTELAEGKFIEILDQIVANNTNDYLQTVVELPESWVGNTHEMQRIVKQIRDRKLLVAYDDFGAGQSRIPDLINVPPDFIKLDRQLISRIEENKVKRSLVKAVVDACNELKVKTLAEGIETIDEMNGCVDLGVDLGQGFLICKPQPAFQLFSAEPKQIPQACPFVRLDMLPK